MTIEIPRFTDRLLAGELQESPLGAWVRYADHAAALAHTCAERESACADRLEALRAHLAQASLQATAAMRPSEPIAWTRDSWAMAANPDHPLGPRLDVQILFEGEWFSREEDEVEIDDEEEGHSGKVEWLFCELHQRGIHEGDKMREVAAFRLHVSDCQRLYPCTACGGRGTVEIGRPAGAVPCPACYGEGADLLTEAGEVLQAVYWSWLRSAGPGGGAVADRATPTPAMTDAREARLVAEVEGLRAQRTADGRAWHRERDRVEAAAARLAALLGPAPATGEDRAEGTLEALLAEVEHQLGHLARLFGLATEAAAATPLERVRAVVAAWSPQESAEVNLLRTALGQVAARLGFDAGASIEQVLHAIDYALTERKGAERRADDATREVTRLTGRLDHAEHNRAEAQRNLRASLENSAALVDRHTRALSERDRALEGALADLAMAQVGARAAAAEVADLRAQVCALEAAVKNNYGDGREAMLAECVAALRQRVKDAPCPGFEAPRHSTAVMLEDAAFLEREVTP